MTKASFSIQRRTSSSDIHTQRVDNYNCSISNNSNQNYFNSFYDYEEFLSNAKQRYKTIVKQNMQKSAIENIFQEAIISIDNHHNENDIINLFKELKNRFGGHELINLTIHKDEGYFQKDDKVYYLYKNIIKIDDNWFITKDGLSAKSDDDFILKVDINEFKKIIVLHAHAIFSMFDFNLGRNARMQKKDMVERLKIVATVLNMEYAPQKIYKFIENSEELNGFKEQELKDLDSLIATKNINLFDINTQVAAKELEIEELNQKFVIFQSSLNNLLHKISLKESELIDLNTQIASKEDNIDSLNNSLSMRNANIQALDAAIKQKEFKLDELNAKIYARSQSIAI